MFHITPSGKNNLLSERLLHPSHGSQRTQKAQPAEWHFLWAVHHVQCVQLRERTAILRGRKNNSNSKIWALSVCRRQRLSSKSPEPNSGPFHSCQITGGTALWTPTGGFGSGKLRLSSADPFSGLCRIPTEKESVWLLQAVPCQGKLVVGLREDKLSLPHQTLSCLPQGLSQRTAGSLYTCRPRRSYLTVKILVSRVVRN